MSEKSGDLNAARVSLEGLSVGDALGDRFFMPVERALALTRARALPNPIWRYTDDTNMALSIYALLRARGEIDQDALAASFAAHYHPRRGYGPAMHGYLARIGSGADWRTEAPALFSGSGSYGNGAAMRVAPLGAYFAADLDRVVMEARRSAEVTHAHEEGISGAIAVAVAAAQAMCLRGQPAPARAAFIDLVLPYVPESEVKSGIKRARDLQTTNVYHAAEMLGNGSQVSAQDTVPYALWCVGERLGSYEEAIWLSISALGDIDTNAAIVGGIVACYLGQESIPSEWIAAREPLPEWAFEGAFG